VLVKENGSNLLDAGLPEPLQNFVQNLLAVREGNEQIILDVARGAQIADNLTCLRHIGLAIAVDKDHSSVVEAEVSQLVDCSAVQAGAGDNRVVTVLEAMVLDSHTSFGHLKALCQSFITNSPNVVLLAVCDAIVSEISSTRLPGLLEQRFPLSLLVLGVIPVAERNVEVVLAEPRTLQSVDNVAGVRNRIDLSVGNEGHR